MAKGQPATSSKAARRKATAKDIPVLEDGKSLYLNSVRLQRTVKDGSNIGLVCEVVSSRMQAGPPSAGEQYIVMWYGSDGYPDPHSMEEIGGEELAKKMQNTWEMYPGTWPIPNDPDVELVCVPLQEVGWRVTEAEYLERREAARAARHELETASTKLAKEMKQHLRKRVNKAKEDAKAERPVKQQQGSEEEDSEEEDSEEEDSELDSEGASEEPEGDVLMQHGHLKPRGHLGEAHFTEQVFGQPYELYYVQQQKLAQQQQAGGAQQQQRGGSLKQQQEGAAADDGSAQGTSSKAAGGRTGKTAAAAAAAGDKQKTGKAAAAAAKPAAAKPAAAKPAAAKPAAAASAAAKPAAKKARNA